MRQILPAKHWRRGLSLVLLPLLLLSCTFEKRSDTAKITLEVACFEGGYGLDWHRSVAHRYEETHPNIRIDLWGDPRVDDKIKPRVLRGSPPDLASCSLPVWKLIVAGKLYPLNEALDSPAYGQPLKWRDTLTKGVLSDYTYQGKAYVIPSNLGAWVCWYDKKLFREHGWSPPKTWAEFMKLCADMKSANVEPLAFQGKYPTYAYYTLIALYQRLVPFEKWYAMQDIQQGAFLNPEFIRAAGMVQEMAQKYFQKGAMGMSHTDSQREWVQRRAGMVFCGLWLKNEMKDALPPDFEMSCFPVPTVDGGGGDQKAIYAGGAENFFVFSQAKHPKEAADFLKFMLSKESAQAYTERLDTLSPVTDSYKGVKVSSALQGAIGIMEGRSRIFSERLGLYPELGRTEMSDALGALLRGEIDPTQFANRLEKTADKIRKNPDIYKPPAKGVPE